MFKKLLSDNRIFGALVCALVFIAAGLLYLNRVKSQSGRDVQRTQETVKDLETPKTEGQPAPGGHYHPDGTYHVGPHEAETPSGAIHPATPPVETPRGNKFFKYPHWSDAFLPEDIEAAYADDPEALEIARAVRTLTERNPKSLTPEEFYETGSVLKALSDNILRVTQEYSDSQRLVYCNGHYQRDPSISDEDREKVRLAFERYTELMKLRWRFSPKPFDPEMTEQQTQ